jgi:EmrB/QacA subfamily drug resistance transporter
MPETINSCTLNSASGRWVLAGTLLASAGAFTAGSGVNVALPTIQTHFNTGVAGLQWIVNAYLLTLSAFLIPGGVLGDRLGRKKVFLAGMALFALAAVISSTAASVGELIAMQTLQGLGAALMVPQSLAIINACFVQEERGRAIGIWAGVSGGVSALGPWIAGGLIEHFSWGAAFWMTLPVIAAAFLVTLLFVPENRAELGRSLDWLGTILLLVTLAALTYGLVSEPAQGWSAPAVYVSLAVAIIAGAVFVVAEGRMRSPLIPTGMFKSPLVSGANLATLLLYFALSAVSFFTVLNLQQVQGFSPAQAGLRLLPSIVIITFLAGPAGALADRIGPRLPMALGALIVAAGDGLLVLGGPRDAYLPFFLPGLALLGVGMSLLIAPLTKSALAVEERFSGAASGVNNAVARVAALLAVAVLGAVMASLFAARLAQSLPGSGLDKTQQQQILSQSSKLGGIAIPGAFDTSSQQAARQSIDSSFVYGYRWSMGACSVLALGAAAISFAIIPSTSKRAVDTKNKTT